MDLHRLRRLLRSRRGQRNLFLGSMSIALIFVMYIHFVSISALHTVGDVHVHPYGPPSQRPPAPPYGKINSPVADSSSLKTTEEAETQPPETEAPNEQTEAPTPAPIQTTTEAPATTTLETTTPPSTAATSQPTTSIVASHKPLVPKPTSEDDDLPKDDTTDAREDPFDRKINHLSFEDALNKYYENLKVNITRNGEDPSQPTKSFKDVNELPDHGVLLPHDPSQVADAKEYEACDARNADFELERDRQCQRYLGNVNNMRSIKALSSLLYSGRTLKFKIFYRHNQIEAIVKISQMKFFFEAASEHLAFSIDRALNLSYVPTTAYFPLPVDYMKAAAGVMPVFYSQWFNLYVPEYEFTRLNFASCEAGTPYAKFVISANENHKLSEDALSHLGPKLTTMKRRCSLVAAQLWMKDVHSALNSFLAFPHEYSEKNARKFWRPIKDNDGEKEGLGSDLLKGGTKNHGRVVKYTWPPVRPYRLQALGDICDRFIFDFLLGNTDRGLNDHNNFVYGGCDHTTECSPRGPSESTKGHPKYAFIDHGSSFYSHREPEGNPFTGNNTLICRFRRKTYNSLKFYDADQDEDGPYYKERAMRVANGEIHTSSTTQESRPIVTDIRNRLLPPGIFSVIRMSIFKKVQERLQKMIKVIEGCVERFGEDEVFSL